MDIFQNQCSESLGFDSVLSANHLGSPLHDVPSSPSALNYAPASPYFASFSQTQQPVSQSTAPFGSSSGPNDVILPSIFVKIPTQINQQYQQENRLRSRNVSEIKSEDRTEAIKSEIADMRSLGPPPVPTGASTGTERQLPDVIGGYLNATALDETAPITEALILRCDYCPFATLSEPCLSEHKRAKHDSAVARLLLVPLPCPVCENKFYKRTVLELHLLEDHEMARSEVELLLKRCNQPQGEASASTISHEVNHVNDPLVQAMPPPATAAQVGATTAHHSTAKSRIYIKDVQLLRNPDVVTQSTHAQSTERPSPSSDVMQQPQSAIGEYQLLTPPHPNIEPLPHDPALDAMFPQQSSCPGPGTATSNGSKIFIRNVSLLQSANFAPSSENMLLPNGTAKYRSFLSTASDGCSNPASSPSMESSPVGDGSTPNGDTPTPPPPPPAPSSIVPGNNRIYIKNVDILRNPVPSMMGAVEPMVSSSQVLYNDALGVDSRASSCESIVCTSTPPPPPVASTSVGASVATSGTLSLVAPLTVIPRSQIMSSRCSDDNMLLSTTIGASGTELPSSFDTTNTASIPASVHGFLDGGLQTNTTNVSVESATNQCQTTERRSKIFIKNISVLKQPTIHLKSVDEVNLMTYDEMQMQNLVPSVATTGDDGSDGRSLDVMDADDVPQCSVMPQQTFVDGLRNGTTVGEDNDMMARYEMLDDAGSFTEFDDDDDKQHGTGHGTGASDLAGNSLEGDRGAMEAIQQDEFDSDIILLQSGSSSLAPFDESSGGKLANGVEAWPVGDTASSSSLSQDILVVADLHQPPEKPIPESQGNEGCPGGEVIQLDPIDQQVEPPAMVPEVRTRSPTTSSQSRGRPKGAKRTGITKLKKLYTNLTPQEAGYSCDQRDCGMRFRKQELLEYHRKCHARGAPHGTVCPECGSHEFRSWKTLHTHLWRQHTIDMELYACQLCSFKTPLLARLLKTHMLIHSDERNFKCGVCGKAFKNNKQLRNHRRSHRDPSAMVEEQTTEPRSSKSTRKAKKTTSDATGNESEQAAAGGHDSVLKCAACDEQFANQGLLRSHVESQHPTAIAPAATGKYRCTLCGMLFVTRYQLDKHTPKHSDEKRFKCEHCEYTTNEHNAFRRHRMRHNAKGTHLYKCGYCDYTSIQSTTYRKHLERSHAEVASALLYKCTRCAFVSISELKYQAHQAKHEREALQDGPDVQSEDEESEEDDEDGEEDDGEMVGEDEEEEVEQQQQQQQQPARGGESDAPWLTVCGASTEMELPQDQSYHRACESVNSDIMIVDSTDQQISATATTAEVPMQHASVGNPLQHLVQPSQPIIRPAIFANNFSKVDNFYGYQQQQHQQHVQQHELLQPKILKLTDRLPPHRVSPGHRSYIQPAFQLQSTLPSPCGPTLLSTVALPVSCSSNTYTNLTPASTDSIAAIEQKQYDGVQSVSQAGMFMNAVTEPP
ncbi:uncharacterized protein LOC118464252 [Anopheles albimanus]|uniref:C2H2-type domain-containing protein n=1 Tax=Anopheles albimanus TaxID=7167 RepID=A0A182FC80_ANOAL|nr:uncharacterized protein LOC118464252 [Anopheles albimanus]XP_035787381.1 uncharacterized protein LOC118464252 [Anopheles albimanus]